MRKIHSNIPVLFKPHKWTVEETEINNTLNKNNETIFTVANGYLGVRGFFEEGFCGDKNESDATTMINGIYEYYPYHHIWCRPGFPERFHSIVAQVNPINIKIYLDGELVNHSGKISNYSRVLNMQNGAVKRKFDFTTKSDKIARISFQRFASQTDVHLLCNLIDITCSDDVDVKIVSSLCALSGTVGDKKEEIGSDINTKYILNNIFCSEKTLSIDYKTDISNFGICCAIKENFNNNLQCTSVVKEDCAQNIYTGKIKANTAQRFERFSAYYTSFDCGGYANQSMECAQRAQALGYDKNLQQNTQYWADYWAVSDICIQGDDLVQQGIRYSLFMINQSAGKDGRTNISANGLTGTGYSGHTFWDTEIFMSQMFLYSRPEVVKGFLMYRYNILPAAKKRAIQMDDEGALYAWNSINGEECGHVFEAATAQYHINCDIFYSIFKYYEATNDWQFMQDYGIEMLMETSKCLSHRGNFIPLKNNKFCINVVCGPDEYNPIVDNNLYTNWLTRKQFYFTLDCLKKLKLENTDKYNQLKNTCKIDDNELQRWQKAADNMYIAYSDQLDMYMLDDNFLYKDPIDIEAIPVNKLPLLTHLHPLNLWRYQVCKQADIVLLMHLCRDEFTPQMKKKVFDFYEPKTIHDSSLSAGVHSIVALDIGYTDEAYGYLKQSARMDLDNVNRNTFFGVHAACMGSSFMMIVNGYAGMHVSNNKLSFAPFKPNNWDSYSFSIKFAECVIKVDIAQKTTFTLLDGNQIQLECNGVEITLNKNNRREICENKIY